MTHISDSAEEENNVSDPEVSYCQSWSYPAWLGTYPLHQDTVLDYFKYSDFYDRTCNNELLTMQINMDSNQLQKMKGKEYSVDRSTIKNNPLYLCINESTRKSKDDVELMKVYYSPGVNGHPHRGHIFPMPVIDMIFMNKLRTAMFHVNTAFDNVQHLKTHQLSRGMEWNIKDKGKDKDESSPHIHQTQDRQEIGSNIEMKDATTTTPTITISRKPKVHKQEKQISPNEYTSLVDLLISETLSSSNT